MAWNVHPARRQAALAQACLLALALAAISGCRSIPPDERLAQRLTETRLTASTPLTAPYYGPLTLETALARATAASETVAMLAADVDVAYHQKRAAGDYRDPELRLSYGAGDGDGFRESFDAAGGGTGFRSTTEDRTAYDVGLRFFPTNPFTREPRTAAARAAIYTAAAELLDAQWRVENVVRRLFVQIHFLSATLEADRELTEVYRQALRIQQDRIEQGHGTLADIMTASRRYLEALSDRDRTVRAHDQARRELATLTAMPFDEVHIVMDPELLETPTITGADLAALETEALSRRRDFSTLYWRRVQAEARYREARAGRLPWLTHLQASYGITESTGDARNTGPGLSRPLTGGYREDDDREGWQVDTGITLPLTPRGAREAAVRLAEFRRAEWLEIKGKERIRREIMDALTAVKAAVASRERYREETMPMVRNMETMLATLESQAGLDPIEVARMREQILASRRLEQRAAMEYHLAVIQLEEALGLRLPAGATAEAEAPLNPPL